MLANLDPNMFPAKNVNPVFVFRHFMQDKTCIIPQQGQNNPF
jgi:hypothetical protein